MMSITIKSMIDSVGLDECLDTIIPIDEIHSNVLHRVLAWCTYHYNIANSTPPQRSNSPAIYFVSDGEQLNSVLEGKVVTPFDLGCFGTDIQMITDLMQAAKYLNIPRLLTIAQITFNTFKKNPEYREIRFTGRPRQSIFRTIPNLTASTLLYVVSKPISRIFYRFYLKTAYGFM